MDSLKEGSERPRNPREKANALSALTFLWILKIFWKGFWHELLECDLYEPLEEHTSEKIGNIFEKYWREEEGKARVRRKKPSLLKVILRAYGLKFLLYGICVSVVELVLRVSQPLLLGSLIRYFSPGNGATVTKEEAYYFATGVIVCSALTVLVVHPYMMGIMHIGMKVRIACCSLIYRKALRLSKTALGYTTVGQVVNLLSNDVNRFDQSVIFLHILWIAPIQTFIAMYFLWQQIGIASVVGVITILIFIPFQGWMGRKASLLRMRTALRTDERVRLMNEIITGIQVIKMYTWEIPFSKIVTDVRKKEILAIRNSSYIRGVLLSFLVFHSRLAIFTSVFAYVLLGNYINAEKIFVVISFYNVLRQSMTVFFPQGIGQAAEVLVSVKRLQTFMMYDEISWLQIEDREPDINKKNGNVIMANEETPLLSNGQQNVLHKTPIVTLHKGIEMRKVSAKWFPDVTENTLSNINLCIEPGKLTAIIGTVGAGKTSLLHAILKELPLSEGDISVNGIISYASQEPWLFASSVRQNILFGSEYDKHRYRQVIKVCALKTDFDQFPYGDKTMVGERGVSLSGGQRARINLARAVYKSADIYLLDDPLSAVDTHVGKHIFEKCITGYLENKTVILVTHQLQYLTYVNHVVLMENGRIKVEGNYRQIQLEAEEFTKVISSEQQEEKPKFNTMDSSGNLNRSRLASFQSAGSLDYDEIITNNPTETEEMRSFGTVGSEVYASYFTAGGSWSLLLLMVVLLIFTQLMASGGEYWITFWVNLEEISNSPDKSLLTNTTLPFIISRNMCLYIFTAITIATVVVTFMRTFLFFFMCTQASMKLHNKMFNSITRATMRFFNTNSSGQILNRFSKDMGCIDELLPQSLIDCLQIGLSLIGIIVIVVLINYMLIIPTLLIAVVFYYIRIFYLSTSRSIKRLEGVTRSPVFAHLNASLQGMTTIRAFKAQSILESEFDRHQDLHSSAYYIFLAASRAFAYWLDLVCIVYIAIVTYSFLTLEIGDTFGGSVGLAITQSIGLTGMFQWGMRQSAELENQMTSVERVYEFTNVEPEPPLESAPDKKPPSTWPEKGKIVFSNVFMTYVPDEPPVLKNLCFVVKPKEKVGIVGRTGAGKSSLITALFRLTDIEGDILIDDININTIGLHDLRSKISIIPQEPVLFSGTIRNNLDPFDEYSDYVLWNALEEVELKDVVNELPGGLNGKMSEGGSNFSVGQRQLICLARAIVRNNRLLVMDEATANVDPQTDALIQTAIRQKFTDCTVLTIAHRLHTVMDSDKILVMGNGCVVEYNYPHILLQDTNSTLSKMVEQMGRLTAERLRDIAAENYEKREKENSVHREMYRHSM